MTEQVTDYSRFLKRGKRNAISRRELMRLSGIDNERRLREDIARRRAEGQIICSSFNGKNGGYYLPESREEIEEFVITLESHAKNTFRAIKAAREALKQMDGQMVIDETMQHGSETDSGYDPEAGEALRTVRASRTKEA